MAARKGRKRNSEVLDKAAGRLTPKRARFAAEYAASGNASESARKAGYSATTAACIGHELLQVQAVRDAIAEHRKVIEAQYEVTKERNIGESARIAYANALDYAVVNEAGDLDVDLSRLTREQAAAISEFTVETVTVGQGDAARTTRRARIKLHDKQQALATLNKLLGYNAPEKHEHAGPGGGPIDLVASFETMLATPPSAEITARDAEAQNVVAARKRALAEMEANNGHGKNGSSNGHKK